MIMKYFNKLPNLMQMVVLCYVMLLNMKKRYWAMLTEYLFIIQQIFPLLLGQTM